MNLFQIYLLTLPLCAVFNYAVLLAYWWRYMPELQDSEGRPEECLSRALFMPVPLLALSAVGSFAVLAACDWGRHGLMFRKPGP